VLSLFAYDIAKTINGSWTQQVALITTLSEAKASSLLLASANPLSIKEETGIAKGRRKRAEGRRFITGTWSFQSLNLSSTFMAIAIEAALLEGVRSQSRPMLIADEPGCCHREAVRNVDVILRTKVPRNDDLLIEYKGSNKQRLRIAIAINIQ
jgi:hypothetical protein